MQIQGLHHSHASQSLNRPNQAKSPAAPVESAPAVNSASADQLDLSPEAQQIGQVQSSGPVQSNSVQPVSGIRAEKVDAIRAAIADGTYETPQKLSAALDRLLDTFA